MAEDRRALTQEHMRLDPNFNSLIGNQDQEDNDGRFFQNGDRVEGSLYSLTGSPAGFGAEGTWLRLASMLKVA